MSKIKLDFYFNLFLLKPQILNLCLINSKLTCLVSIAQFTVNIAGKDFNVLVCNVC